MKKSLLLLFLFCIMNSSSVMGQNMLYRNNKSPLLSKPYVELPLGSIKPSGWLNDQLNRMAAGMTGNLDKLYPLVMGERNGWLGGDGDMWERGPYWIDGLLPLAYILDNQELKNKAQKWVEWALNSQKENGFFGPDTDLSSEPGLQRTRTHDWWPRIVVLKFLQQYYEATSDERVISFMTKYFKYQLAELPAHPLSYWSGWASERGGDNLMTVYWLYNITGDDYLLKLGDLISEQTIDWKGRLSDRTTLSSIFSIHCVNLAQGIKEPVIRYQATGGRSNIEAVEIGTSDIRRTIGWPIGLYGADEMLHSGNPTQGSELCSAVEMMFSLENMVQISGRTDWADWLERVAFNALPTQITDAFDARQYYQQLNQVEVSHRDRNFVTCYNGFDQTFGLLSGFPCCTSNLHQGWPKFTNNLWYASDDAGLAAMAYAPCVVEAKVASGTNVRISEETNYPFEETINFKLDILDRKVKKLSFPLHLRIPGWCNEANVLINGEKHGAFKAGETALVAREWKSGDVVMLELPMEVTISRWYENSAVVERGPLVYALRMNEKWEKIRNPEKFRVSYGDWHYQVTSDSPWNYCLLGDNVKQENVINAFTVVKKEFNGYPWNVENSPLEIHTTAKRMKDWVMYQGNAGPLPYSPQHQTGMSGIEDIVLIPYGCTTLRITEFPVTH